MEREGESSTRIYVDIIVMVSKDSFKHVTTEGEKKAIISLRVHMPLKR